MRHLLRDTGIALLRLGIGGVFIAHGVQKLALFGVAGFAGYLGQLGVPMPTLSAAAAIAAELVGGILLFLGLGTRYVVWPMIFTMLVAIATVHWSKGFFGQAGGFEYPLVLAIALLSLGLTGPGALALDRLWRHRPTHRLEPAVA